MAHTKEPWAEQYAYMKRAAQCVNALAGYNPDAVADVVAALESIAARDLLEVSGFHARKWCIPETGSEYESKDPIFKRSAFQNAQEFQKIAREALTRLRSIDNA